MKKINNQQKALLNGFFDFLEIKDPVLTIIEISENRTDLLDELNFNEAQALINRFEKMNETHFLEIKDVKK